MNSNDGSKESVSKNVERIIGKRIDLSRDQKPFERARDQNSSDKIDPATQQIPKENPYKNVLRPPQEESNPKSNSDGKK